MALAIISSGSGWHVQDLLRAAAGLGITAHCRSFSQLHAGIWGNREQIGPEPILVRTMATGSLEQIIFRMDVLQRCQAHGTLVLNPPKALESCIDKYLSTARLAAAGLAVPDTFVCQETDEALNRFVQLGGEVVIKPLFGSEGRGMVRVTDRETCWRVCHALVNSGAVLYLQRFIRHEGFDLRLFVLGDRVLAAMRRRHAQDWRTNIAQGAQAEVYQPSNAEVELALRATAAVGALYAGVDILPGSDGRSYVLEVNGVPGWRKLGEVSGIDVASEILQFLTQLPSLPPESPHATT